MLWKPSWKLHVKLVCSTTRLAMVWHLTLIALLSMLPGALATGWDDFADDLATDLVCALSYSRVKQILITFLILGTSYLSVW
ncbi:hypothetical protein BO78DRAFT_229837 [Aspergillus sclerotiicarbonarius CBS 121057]|uniref:Uncharacterized protein n=1 Tax=Aspergillus sclerotiicarbonarius (strain CBS 121057 / IBT 28362) TaxID=1448318 RepID=A0A319F8N5_ASPSB|nr:hypothetical protein BO78DRAFT_229837 [Aspergillus sclerotiicarbonarius CBS 121057]